jgi:hypothetical protein
VTKKEREIEQKLSKLSVDDNRGPRRDDRKYDDRKYDDRKYDDRKYEDRKYDDRKPSVRFCNQGIVISFMNSS